MIKIPKHPDFQKIYKRFVKQYGKKEGEDLYYSWINKHSYDDTKPFPGKAKNEKKEFFCRVRGLEFKETDDAFHVEGLIATSHIDDLCMQEEMSDIIPKETLESFADQINNNPRSRIMGLHHSEGKTGEFFGVADVENNPAKVIQLTDGEWGLFVDTKFLKDDDGASEIAKMFQNGNLDSFSITYDTVGFSTADFDWIGESLVRVLNPDTKLCGYTASSSRGPTPPANPNAIATGYGYKEFKELVMEDKEKKKWIQGAVSEKDEGKFEAYCKHLGFSGVCQACINHAVKEGGHAAKMANFAINVSKGKYHHPSNEKKELGLQTTEVIKMQKNETKEQADSIGEAKNDESSDKKIDNQPLNRAEEKNQTSEGQAVDGGSEDGTDAEKKEFKKFLTEKKEKEQKELLEKTATKIAEGVLSKMEVKEKVLKDSSKDTGTKTLPLEVKELREGIVNPKIEIKELFRRAGAVCDAMNIDWQISTTTPAESREFKNFTVNGTRLEYKGLGLTTNQNADTDYLQSSAELQDVYDPVIYNALNQATITWNLLSKDDLSKKGNNQVQFTLKTAANASAAFYTGNAVATDNVTRLKYQTKFKKVQVGVSVDGDMIAAARGGPVNDVFAQEVMDSTLDMMAVINAALFAEVGAETASGVIGFEYIADSASNTTLYNLTRSAANKLSPDSAGDTYIDGSSAIISMTNLRSMKRQALAEGANKKNLVFITNPLQADLLRGKFDDSRRMLTSKDTDFGFSTDLFVDGIPVFEDTDCNTDDWWLIDLETHRVAIWVPATIERLGKVADSEDAFIKMYFATYNRAPRRLVMCYGNATS